MAYWHKNSNGLKMHKPRPLYNKQDLLPACLVGLSVVCAVIILLIGWFSEYVVHYVLELLSNF